MSYKLVIFNTKGRSKSAPIVEQATWYFNDDINNGDIGIDKKELFSAFDSEKIKSEIEASLGNKCRVPIRNYSTCDPYLEVFTSIDNAYEVFLAVQRITEKNDLVLFDSLTKKCYFKDNQDIRSISEMKVRSRDIRIAISKEIDSLKAIRKINEYYDPYWEVAEEDFVVTILRKIKGVSFEERVKAFYECLLKNINSDEKLYCEDNCFVISRDLWKIRFCFEGYNKHSNKIGFIKDEIAKSEVLHRMSGYESFCYLNKHNELDSKEIFDRLNIYEMQVNYPNPCDRFAASIKISKRLFKSPFDIKYSIDKGYFSGYGNIDFEFIDTFWKDERSYYSVLSLSEETASFILPIIADVYPYIYDRYYDDSILSYEMIEEIINRIKEVKKMILDDHSSPELSKYLKRFEFWDLYSEEQKHSVYGEENPAEFVYEHRKQILELYNIFIDWLNQQMERYNSEESMLRIRGM